MNKLFMQRGRKDWESVAALVLLKLWKNRIVLVLELLAENGEPSLQDWFMMVIGGWDECGERQLVCQATRGDESSASSQNDSIPIDTAQGFGE